jgi:hypothetical protein
MKRLISTVSLSLFAVFAFSGCDTPGETALLGAATGAAVGGLLHGRGDQALVGAAIGAGTGYLVGKAVQHERRRAYDEGYYDSRGDNRRDDYRYEREHYPVARSTGRYGFVTSPYYPYNRIDVRGIPRGAQVRDPSTGKVFINP